MRIEARPVLQRCASTVSMVFLPTAHRSHMSACYCMGHMAAEPEHLIEPYRQHGLPQAADMLVTVKERLWARGHVAASLLVDSRGAASSTQAPEHVQSMQERMNSGHVQRRSPT